MFGWEEDGAVSPWGASVDLSILDGSSGFALEGSTAGGHFGWARVGSMLIMALSLGRGAGLGGLQPPKVVFGSSRRNPCDFAPAPGISIGVGIFLVCPWWGSRYVRTRTCTVLLRYHRRRLPVSGAFVQNRATLTMIFKCRPANNGVSGGPQTAFTQYCIQWLFDSKSRGSTCPFPINFVF